MNSLIKITILFLMFLPVSLVSAEWTTTREQVSSSNIVAGNTIEVSFSVVGEYLNQGDCVNSFIDVRLLSDTGEGTSQTNIPAGDCCATDEYIVDYDWGIDRFYGGNCSKNVPVTLDVPGKYDLRVSLSSGQTYGLIVDVAKPFTPPDQDGDDQDPLQVTTDKDIIALIERLTDYLFWIVSSIAAMMIVIGGLVIVTSRGEPQRATKGRNIILYTLIGFAIMSMSKGIIALIQAFFGVKQP